MHTPPDERGGPRPADRGSDSLLSGMGARQKRNQAEAYDPKAESRERAEHIESVAQAQALRASRRSLKSQLGTAIVSVLVLGFVVYLFGGGCSRSDSPSGNVHGAWAYTQIYVEKKLGAAKADFRFGGFRDVTEIGDSLYRVDSYVDTQNVFGGPLRRSFVCEIQQIKGGWQVTSFSWQ